MNILVIGSGGREQRSHAGLLSRRSSSSRRSSATVAEGPLVQRLPEGSSVVGEVVSGRSERSHVEGAGRRLPVERGRG